MEYWAGPHNLHFVGPFRSITDMSVLFFFKKYITLYSFFFGGRAGGRSFMKVFSLSQSSRSI